MILTVLSFVAAGILLVLLIAFFGKKEYSITAEILINRPQKEVFNFVKHLKNQEKYSKWVMADPNVKLVYKGTDGTVGFIAAWSSENKNVGVGEQEITGIKEGERYGVEIRFEKPFKGISQAYTTTEAISAEQTKVTTTFETNTPFPMNLMIPLIKKMLTKDLNENAANLKNVLEA